MGKTPKDGHDNFSATEVATLIENLERKFDVVAEAVLPLRENMADVKERLSAVEFRVGSLEDVVRTAIPSLSREITEVKEKVG